MGKLRQAINNWSLRTKTLAVILIVHLFFLLPTFVWGGHLIVNQQQEQLQQALENSINSTASSINTTLNIAKNLSNSIQGDSLLQNQLSLLCETTDLSKRSELHNTLQSLLMNYLWSATPGYINAIRLDTDDVPVFVSANQSITYSDEVFQDVIARAWPMNGAAVLCGSSLMENTVFVTRVVREVQHFSLKPIGVLTICINMDRLIAGLSENASPYVMKNCLISDQDVILYTSGLFQNGQLPASTDTPTSNLIHLNGHWFFTGSAILGQTGWKYQCMIPFDEGVAKMSSFYLMLGLTVLGAWLVSALIWFMMASRILRHFDRLIAKMHYFSSHRMQLPANTVDYSTRKDEIGQLHQQFDAMADDVTRLVQENYVKELLARDAQLQALESQINPHFLYNVLESINWRAHMIGADKISLMVESLGSLLRVTLDKEKKEHTLQEEITLVNHYVTIQKIRYEERLIYSQDVDESALRAYVPKMILQPLVENSVRYGLENSWEEETCITLTVLSSNDRLILKVSNTGSAFEDNLLQRMRSKEIRPGGYGIGLLNISDRLRLTYNEAEPLTLFNENGQATACINIPLRFNPQEVPHAENDYCG